MRSDDRCSFRKEKPSLKILTKNIPDRHLHILCKALSTMDIQEWSIGMLTAHFPRNLSSFSYTAWNTGPIRQNLNTRDAILRFGSSEQPVNNSFLNFGSSTENKNKYRYLSESEVPKSRDDVFQGDDLWPCLSLLQASRQH
jgi:hypothetical protein